MTYQIRAPRKLIEVALPLDDINVAAAREKSIRHGHPSTLHLWWARRPLAAARAVLFAQLVNDPGYESGQGFQRGVNKKEAAKERERLFKIIRELVKWENTNNETVLEAAREEIRKSWRETCALNKDHPQAAELFNPDRLPAFHDPFAGGGAIPLEAQRLGLEAHASDLNPVAVLINKAMIEIPPKFAGRAPVGPLPPGEKQGRMAEDWSGARGLAEDVRRYGHWMRGQAQQRIGHLYPKIEITAAMAKDRADLKPLIGQELTVIAWLWARTVRSPNPAYSNIDVPLASTFLLSTKAGKESWVEPIVESGKYRFEVRSVAAGEGKAPVSAKVGTKLSRGANFRCVMSNTPIEPDYIKAEGIAGRMGARLMAVVVEGARSRVYLAPSDAMQAIAESAKPTWQPDTALPNDPRNFWTLSYGLTTFGDLFTPRQLVALTTFSDLVTEARDRIRTDALAAGMPDDGRGLEAGGTGATAYAEAIATYADFVVSKLSESHSTLCTWSSAPKNELVVSTFRRQALPMTWDYAEANPFADSSGSVSKVAEAVARVCGICLSSKVGGAATQSAAQSVDIRSRVVSTDPPYYDNIGYADLSDFFYVWHRRSLRQAMPDLFSTIVVPKGEELVATPYRHGGVAEAETFFMAGMTAAMRTIAERSHRAFPVTIYYAFKQSDTNDAGTSSTGWETFLAAVMRAGYVLCGTWPMRTERDARSIGIGTNALASSIILVCRRRSTDAVTVSRKDFIRELKAELAVALEAMLGEAAGGSPIAPVDLAQAAIGPGMAVYSKYAAVLEANGEPMSVHTALTLINRQVDEILGAETFDVDTNFCMDWFQQEGWTAGAFGQADVLARAKATSVEGIAAAGVVESGAGKVRLLRPDEYPAGWDPATDQRIPIWEALHQLSRALSQAGESAAGTLLARMPDRGADIRRLAFWLYTLCERKGWAEDARRYNELVTAWHGIEAAAQDAGQVGMQGSLDV